jgi:hypothetical protein
MKAAEAGLVRWALRPPASSSSIASPEPMGIARTTIVCPLVVFRPSRLKAAVVSSIQGCFSEP